VPLRIGTQASELLRKRSATARGRVRAHFLCYDLLKSRTQQKSYISLPFDMTIKIKGSSFLNLLQLFADGLAEGQRKRTLHSSDTGMRAEQSIRCYQVQRREHLS
jgi:hypothetical protein